MQVDPAKRKQQENKMTPVISGGAKLKKQTGVEKASKVFLEEDIKSVGSYICKDVILPATKKLLYDMVTNALGISLWGQNGAPRNNNGGSNVARVSYNSFSNNGNQQKNNYRANPSTGWDYDKITFTSAGDAELVLDAMRDSLDRGYIVSVADLYDLAGISTSNYMVKKYGWDDLSLAKVARTFDGWSIVLPKPTPIE